MSSSSDMMVKSDTSIGSSFTGTSDSAFIAMNVNLVGLCNASKTLAGPDNEATRHL